MIDILSENKVLTVTQANLLAKELLESVPIWVEGEAFDVRQKDRKYRYHYFYLKDPDTEYQLPCIAEPYYIESLGFPFEEGSKYKMFGNLTLWEKGGKYQFVVRKVEPVGEGNLLKQLEELKQKLQSLGFFNESAKKQIPKYPEKIGVVTSLASGSAAWEDFRRHSVDVFPFLEIIVRDSYVQGEKAAKDVVNAIRELDKLNLDVIVVTRGGGAMEDLMAFNCEVVADAIFQAKTPIVSAIGHEKDFTIADLVADARASTPTNAAHLITQNYNILFERMDHITYEIKTNLNQRVSNLYQQLDIYFERFMSHQEKISQFPEKLSDIKKQLLYLTTISVDKSKEDLKSAKEMLTLLSPQKTLERGYGLVTDEEGKLVRDTGLVDIGQQVNVRLARGLLKTKVSSKSHV